MTIPENAKQRDGKTVLCPASFVHLVWEIFEKRSVKLGKARTQEGCSETIGIKFSLLWNWKERADNSGGMISIKLRSLANICRSVNAFPQEMRLPDDVSQLVSAFCKDVLNWQPDPDRQSFKAMLEELEILSSRTLASAYQSVFANVPPEAYLSWIKIYDPAFDLLHGGQVVLQDAESYVCGPALPSVVRRMIFSPNEWPPPPIGGMVRPVANCLQWVCTIRRTWAANVRDRNQTYIRATAAARSEFYILLTQDRLAVGCINVHFDREHTNDELISIGQNLCNIADPALLTSKILSAIEFQRGAAARQLEAIERQGEIRCERLRAGLSEPDSEKCDVFEVVQAAQAQSPNSDRIAIRRKDLPTPLGEAAIRMPVVQPMFTGRLGERVGVERVEAAVLGEEALVETIRELFQHATAAGRCCVEYGIIQGMPLCHVSISTDAYRKGLFRDLLDRMSEDTGTSQTGSGLVACGEVFPTSIDWNSYPLMHLCAPWLVTRLSCGQLHLFHDGERDSRRIGIRLEFPRADFVRLKRTRRASANLG